MNRKLTGNLLALVPALLTFAAYLPTLRNGFVIWDDQLYVYENPFIRSIDLNLVKWAFTESSKTLANWHPLTVFSHAIDYMLWGLNPTGHHLTSIILHSLNTMLVFVLAARLLQPVLPEQGSKLSFLVPLSAAMLFGLHPLHVESVSWVSQRKDLLCAFFFLVSVISWTGYCGGAKKHYYFSLASFALALLSKPMAISLPLVILLIDWYPFSRLKREGLKKIVLEKIPFFALSTVFAALTIWAQGKSGALSDLQTMPLAYRIPVPFKAVVFYLYKMVLPVDLAPLYPLPPMGSSFDLVFAASILVFSAITIYSVLAVKKRKLILTAWLFYLMTLAPASGLVQAGIQAAADRYTYLPSLGPFLAIAAGIFSLASWKNKLLRAASFAALFIICSLMIVKTVRQESIWKDSLSLWSHEIRLYPGSPQGYNNRGLAYEKAGADESAIQDFEAAIQLSPLYFDALYNLAYAYQKLGRCDEAIPYYTSAIAIKPGKINPYMNRGACYGSAGVYASAVADFTRSIDLEPGNPAAYFYRGITYLRTDEIKEAIKDLETAVRLDPANDKALYNLGAACLESGDRRKAAEYLKRASALGSSEATAMLREQGLLY